MFIRLLLATLEFKRNSNSLKMYSPYLELAKQDKRPKKYYGKVIIYSIAFWLVFLVAIMFTSEFFQLSSELDQIPSIEEIPYPMNVYHLRTFIGLFLGVIFLFIFPNIHDRKIITLINTSNSIRYKSIIYAFGIWFILYGIIYIIGFLSDPSKYHLESSIIDWLSIELLLLIINRIIGIIIVGFIVAYILQGISLIISNPLYLFLTLSIFSGLTNISSTEYYNWIQSFILGFYLTFFRLWLIYKDDGIEVLLGIGLVNSLYSPIIIQPDGELVFTDFNPLFTNTPALSLTTNLIITLVQSLIFYLIYFRVTRQRSKAN